ncbi:MAG: zinc ABC transporter substrate-binding protein [Planctomycetota bacterium]|nr:zinc ABC transporter substrate-binding protein [Planctomycetota bacterium]MDA1215111.1 zinc ABC transporter substrate-binding protein [Planctomycetota bacterium]
MNNSTSSKFNSETSGITVRRRHGTIGAMLLLAVIVGCDSGQSDPPSASSRVASVTGATYDGPYPIRIVTTTGMVTDIVKQIAGEQGDVNGLIGASVDPHLHSPSRNDVKALFNADLVIYSGLMLEGRMGDTFVSVGRSGKPVFPVTEGIDEKYLLEPPSFAGHWDPHVWMDVSAWSECVENVAGILSDFDPPHAELYRSRCDAYRVELKQLDDYVRGVISSIPKTQRVLVTAHDAFEYFSRAYDIEIRSVQGLSTESEAGVDDVNRLVEYIAERRLKAIFVESSVPPKNIQAVVEGVRQKGVDIHIGGELFSDAMGVAGTYEGTYIGMIDHNATTIARSLGGEAPETGFQGKLKPVK